MKKITLLMLFALVLALPMWAYDFSDDSTGTTIFYNILSDSTVEVTYGTKDYLDGGTPEYTGDMTIPETVEYSGATYTVTAVGEDAFNNCASLTSIDLANSITTIDPYAFQDCQQMASIRLSDNLQEIGRMAFDNCTALEAIDLPTSLTTIGSNAFETCTSLKAIVVPDNVTFVDQGAFNRCISLTSVSLSNSLTEISASTFNFCSALPAITIGSNITSVGNNAFAYCGALKEVTVMAKTPPTCGDFVFSNVEVAEATLYVPKGSENDYAAAEVWSDFGTIEEMAAVGDKIFVDGLYYNITSDNEVEVTWGGSGLWYGTEEYVGDITIPASVDYGGTTYSVVAIDDYAFFECYDLTGITIANSVESIGEWAFNECYALERVDLGSGMKTIGDYAFGDCYSLTEITIPDNVETMGECPFCYCYSLESATIGSGVKEMGPSPFAVDYLLTKLEVSEANENFCSVDNVIYTKDMTTIVCYAPGLEAETYEIPETVTTLGQWAFCGAWHLTSIDVPDNVTTLEPGVFYWCDSSQTATIGNGVETISEELFGECYALKSITLGSNVAEVDYDAFYLCYSLESFTCLNPEPATCAMHAFYYVDTDNATLYVPKGSKDAYSSAEYWSNFGTIEELPAVGDKIGVDGLCYTILSDTEAEVTYNTDDDGAISPYTQTSIIIPSSITRGVTYNVVGVGYWAFYGCENLSSIDLGSVTYIGEQAFRDCTGLSSVELPESLTEIGEYAFSGCSALAGELTIPDNVVTIRASAFSGCSGLSAVVIGSGVETIGDSAFQYCENLTSVTFGENVVSIGGTTFASTNLEGDLVIPDKVTTIGDWAFSGCGKLTSLTLGSSLENIGGSAFYSCDGLTSVTSLNTVPPTCGEGVFEEVNTSAIPLYVPVGYTEVYSSTSPWSDFIVMADVKVGDKIFVDGIYYNVTSATEVEVTYGGDDYIYGTAEYVGEIEIPSEIEYENYTYTVTAIGEYAFARCGELTSVDMPNTVTAIKPYSFQECYLLATVRLSDNVEEIGRMAFDYCSALEAIDLPTSLTTIGSYVFELCTSLKTIVVPDNVTFMDDGVFNRCTSLTSVYLSNSLTEISASTFNFCSALPDVTIGSNITSVGKSAFAYCEALKKVTVEAETPPACGDFVFSNVDTDEATLYVPLGTHDAYSTADTWEEFGNIVEIDMEGISTLTPDNVEIVDYYTIDGKRLNEPQRGVNVVRYSDGTNRKVLVK